MTGVLTLKAPSPEHIQIMIMPMEVSYQSQKEVKLVKDLKVKSTSIHPHTPQSCHSSGQHCQGIMLREKGERDPRTKSWRTLDMKGKSGARQGDRAWTVRDREGELKAVKGKEMKVKKEWGNQRHWF